MAVTIKSKHEIQLMREAGKRLEDVHNQAGRDHSARDFPLWKSISLGKEAIRAYGCIPNFLNYNGYPASICVSVNDEVVHGIPKKNRILQEGDIVSLDAGLIL